LTYEWGPFVTDDNTYLFYSSGTSESNQGTYWIRADKLIDSLKHTNYMPYLKSQIPNQRDTVGHPFNYQFPDSAFIDDDGNNTLTYTAKLSSGLPLPSWLLFDSTSRTFSGTPPAAATLTIKITATDTANASVVCTFKITLVADPYGIEENNGQLPKEFRLFQNYPNPFNPSTSISFSLPSNSFVSLKVFDLTGREVATIVSEELPAGKYARQWNAHGISNGVYYYRIQAGSFTETKKLMLLK
jgi:hypothetical protein